MKVWAVLCIVLIYYFLPLAINENIKNTRYGYYEQTVSYNGHEMLARVYPNLRECYIVKKGCDWPVTKIFGIGRGDQFQVRRMIPASRPIPALKWKMNSEEGRLWQDLFANH